MDAEGEFLCYYFPGFSFSVMNKFFKYFVESRFGGPKRWKPFSAVLQNR